MTYELAAIVIVWLLVFALMQSSMAFASAIYEAGVAPPWPSRALTAGTATGLVACLVMSFYRRNFQLFSDELMQIAIVALGGVLCAALNRWFFKRWW